MTDLGEDYLDYEDEYEEPVRVFYDISLTSGQMIGAVSVLILVLAGVFWAGYQLGGSGREIDQKLAELEAQEGLVVAAPAGPPLVIEEDGSLRVFGEVDPPEEEDADIAEATEPTETSESESSSGLIDEEESSPPEPAETTITEPKIHKSPYNLVDAPSSWMVQVLATPLEIEARQLEQKLRNGGFPVFVTAIRKDGKNFFRVRVGAFEGKVEAQRVASDLQSKYGLGTWIIR